MDNKHNENATQIEGRYANYFAVGHNAFEFALDFGQLYVNGLGSHIHTRVLTSPSDAKSLLQTLAASISKYEGRFGVINVESSGGVMGSIKNNKKKRRAGT